MTKKRTPAYGDTAKPASAKRTSTKPNSAPSTSHSSVIVPGRKFEGWVPQIFNSMMRKEYPFLNLGEYTVESIGVIHRWFSPIYRADPTSLVADTAPQTDPRVRCGHIASCATMQTRLPFDPHAVVAIALYQGVPVRFGEDEDPIASATLPLWPGDVRLQCFGPERRHCAHATKLGSWPNRWNGPRCDLDCPAGQWTASQPVTPKARLAADGEEPEE